MKESEFSFDVKEAIGSENVSQSSAWKADFEGAFGSKELLDSLEQAPYKQISRDPPGEEWSDYSNTDGT